MKSNLSLSTISGERRNGTSFKDVQGLFINKITTEHIYESMQSSHSYDDALQVKFTLESMDFDIGGVIDENDSIIGYVVQKELENGYIQNYIKSITADSLISDSTPIAKMLTILSTKEYVFILSANQVKGILTRADVNKPIVRIYLFGIISLFELNLNFWINSYYKNECEWKEILKTNRVIAAQDIFKLRKGKNEELSLLECIQICDKKSLLSSSKEFTSDFNFTKTKLNKLISNIETVRNELAHSQKSITANLSWTTFTETINDIENFLVMSEKKQDIISKELQNADF